MLFAPNVGQHRCLRADGEESELICSECGFEAPRICTDCGLKTVLVCEPTCRCLQAITARRADCTPHSRNGCRVFAACGDV